MNVPWLSRLVFMIAALYAGAGFGGASGYLRAMSFFSAVSCADLSCHADVILSRSVGTLLILAVGTCWLHSFPAL